METFVIKCNNNEIHNHSNREIGVGNVLMFYKGNSIYIKCTDNKCKVWNKITINIPGINIDFSKAALQQKKMPRDYVFSAKTAPVIIEEK